MSNSQYKIGYYLAWCGAEAEHQFESQKQYETARALLDKIAKFHIRGDELPLGYSVADYYFIEKDQRDEFQKIMGNLGG